MNEKPVAGIAFPTKSSQHDPGNLTPQVAAALAAQFPDRASLHLASVEIPASAGINNETILLEAGWTQAGAPCSAGYVLRLETPDNLFFEPSFAEHQLIGRTLRQTGTVPVPEVFAPPPDASCNGRRYYFMERVDGQIPGDKPLYCTAGWMLERGPRDCQVMWQGLVAAMVAMHQADPAEFAFLARPERGKTGFEQMLAHHFDYMDDALAGEGHPVIEAGADWLRANLPDDTPTGFSWGDARPQNVIFGTDNAVRAILDWDMASLGGAEADLAWWTVMHHSSVTARGLKPLPGWGSPAETRALWERLAGRRLRHMHYHFVFAAFRAAIVVRRLARLLKDRDALPPGMEQEFDNNNGTQFLASLLELPGRSTDGLTWPEPSLTGDC